MKKNKKRKPLGSIQFKVSLRAMTKEEMNEVAEFYFSIFLLIFGYHLHVRFMLCVCV